MVDREVLEHQLEDATQQLFEARREIERLQAIKRNLRSAIADERNYSLPEDQYIRVDDLEELLDGSA